MNRVLVARSLKFSEHRTNEPSIAKDAKSEVFVHKKSEMKKGGDGGKLRAKFSSNTAQDKLKTPTIVAALVAKEAKEKKKQPRGVWSPLGEIYSTHGMPDLELGNEAKIDKVKKLRRAQDNREERQKLEDLMELFRTTKSSLSKVNLFQRPEGGADGGLLPSVAERVDGASNQSTPRNGRGESLFQSSRADQMTTIEKIAALRPEGSAPEIRKQRAKKKPAEALEQINHLKEGRGHHLSRWRGGFEETKSAMDRTLIQTLVKRAEDRDLVYENQALMDNALSIASEERRYNTTASKRQHCTIWERARIKGMDARNAELQKQARRIQENAQKGRRAVHGSRHGRARPGSKGISPRLMMRSASQPEFTSRPRQPKIRAMS